MYGVVEVDEMGRRIADCSCAAAGDDELCGLAVALARLGSSVSLALSRVLGALDERGVCEREFGLATGSWLAREAALPALVARQHVKVGAMLASPLPAVDGRIGFHHARVLSEACSPRTTGGLVALSDELVALAESASFERWRAEVKGIVELIDSDGAHDPDGDLARNRLTVADTIDGTTHLSGQLVGDIALGVHAAIDAKADELFHRFHRDAQDHDDLSVPARPTLMALALAELCRAGHAVDPATTRPPRPEITLVVPADDPAVTVDTGGTRLADGTVRTLRCDADLHAVVVDSLGVPLDLGRHVRLATAAQRRAMAVRDGGCVFPGCHAPASWTDAHHLDQFRHGGRTDVARLASLCRHHHGITHRRGWAMHASPDGWFWWQTPTGRTFWSQRHGRRRTGPTPTDPDPP